MIHAGLWLALSTLPGGSAAEPDVNALLQNLRTRCAAGAAAPDCRQARIALEWVLLRDLNRLYLEGRRLERSALLEAAQAFTPEVAAFGLRRLADNAQPADAAVAAAGLDSPVAEVRAAAADLARALPDRSLRLWADRASRQQGRGREWSAEPAPDPKALGAPLYPGARHRPGGGGQGLAVYSSTAPVEQVLAFYAKGRRVLTGAELESQRRARGVKKGEEQELAMRMLAELQKGRDPQQVAQEMSRSAQAASRDWREGIEGSPGVLAPKYVVLEESGKAPVRVVAVYRDEALGATAIAFRLPPAPSPATRSRRDPAFERAFSELQRRQD